MNLRRSAHVLLLLCLALLTVSSARAHAQGYTSVVVFGDSLSDTGNFAHVVQAQYGARYPGAAFNYADGRFTDATTTTGASQAYAGVWVEQLAAQFAAKPAVKNSLDGGTNYAYGDATTANGSTVITESGVSITVANMGQQVVTYLATSPRPTASTLYILFGGGNDLFANPTTAGASTAASNEAALVQQLVNAGATNFLVPNLPPLGDTPAFAATSSMAALNSASSMFRSLLATDLQAVILTASAKGIKLNLYQPDLNSQFASQGATPASYGLANVTTPAQGLSTVSPDTYLFWDTVHPTTTGHHLIATAAESLLTTLLPSTTTLTLTPAYTLNGQAVTLKAVVSGSGTAKPTGLVIFTSGTATPPNVLGSGTLDATGTATATFAPALAGSPYSISAVYAGDLTYAYGESAPQTLNVLANSIPTMTTLTASTTSPALGASVTFTANVTSSSGAPPGTITFQDGNVVLGSATLSNGSASLSTAALASGSHAIRALYSPTGVYGVSTSSVVNVVVSSPALALSFSTATLTVQHGSSGSVGITITPSGGASGSVALSCGTLPSHASCVFSPATVTVGASAGTSTLTLATNVASAADLPAKPGSRYGLLLYAATLLPLFGLTLAGRRRLRRHGGVFATALLLTALAASVTGCGGGSSTATANTTTAPGSYTVVVTATLSGTATIAGQGTVTVLVQ